MNLLLGEWQSPIPTGLPSPGHKGRWHWGSSSGCSHRDVAVTFPGNAVLIGCLGSFVLLLGAGGDGCCR